MAKWTRRDVVKASLAASAAMATRDLLAESRIPSHESEALEQASATAAHHAAIAGVSFSVAWNEH